jgi:RNA 2',3'-cyclic 3'-phosphodiesterase
VPSTGASTAVHDGRMAPTRTFVAIALPAEVRSAIAEIASRGRRSGPPGLRWANPAQAHLTLAFLGDQDDAALERVRAATQRVARAHAPVTCSLDGAGAFPHSAAARVVWLGWGEGAGAVAALHDALRAALDEEGVSLAARRFRPHVTLARAPAPLDARDLVAALATWRSTPWTVTSLDVMASRLTPRGAEHVRLERCEMGRGR